MAVDKNPVDKNYTFTALTGHDGNSTKVQYCATENGTYHDTFESGDMYMKISTDGTTWSSAIKFIGEDGTGILRVTTEPTAYTTTTGGFTPAYRMSLSTVKSQSGVDNIIIGDVVFYSYNTYKIGYIDESYVYLAAAVSIRGSTGGYGAGSWVPNVSNVTRSNNDYYKSGGTNQQWDARMYSSESYSNGLVISCSCDVVATNNIATMIGLLATSKTASSFANSDLAFGFYFRCDGTNKNIYACEAGSNKSTLLTNYTASTVCKLEWDGENVRYYIDGVVKRTVALASGTSYRMAASFWGKNSYKLKNVTYSPYVRGATGTTGVTTECSAQSIKINQRRNGTLDFDSQTFTCKLYRGSTQLTSVGTPTVTTSGTAGGVTATIATSNGTSTITVKSSNGGAICKNLVIIVSMTCESVTYTFEVPVMATVMGKYGGIETSLPTASASEQGNYYCFNGTAGTYTPTCVYACYRTAASTYAWTLDTSKEANMTALGDASSIAELTESNNATAFSIVKNLVANNAFIANLFAKDIQTESLSLNGVKIIANITGNNIINSGTKINLSRMNRNTILGANVWASSDSIVKNEEAFIDHASDNCIIGCNTNGRGRYCVGDVFIGTWAGGNYQNINKGYNDSLYSVGIGLEALYYVTTGDGNIGIGFNAGGRITTGSENICIGTFAGKHNSDYITGDGNICIGVDTGLEYLNYDNQINIGNRIFVDYLGKLYIGTSWTSKSEVMSLISGHKFKGIYSSTTQYSINDLVISSSKLYKCIVSSRGNAVTNTTYWEDITSKGSYIKLSNGLKIEWGYQSNPGSNKAVTVNFDTECTFAIPPVVLVSPKSSSGNTPYFSSFGYGVTTTSFSYYNSSTAYVWIAIGYAS